MVGIEQSQATAIVVNEGQQHLVSLFIYLLILA